MNVPDATLAYRVSKLEQDVTLLNRKLDRLTWAIVALTLTIASSTIVWAITAATVGVAK